MVRMNVVLECNINFKPRKYSAYANRKITPYKVEKTSSRITLRLGNNCLSLWTIYYGESLIYLYLMTEFVEDKNI